MAAPLIAGLSAAAKALLKTPAGQKAVERGSKAVARFLRKNDPDAFKPSEAQRKAGEKLQKTMGRRRRNEKIRVGTAAAAAGAAAGRKTKNGVREDWRDMKATAAEQEKQRKKVPSPETRKKISQEAATLLNKGGFVGKKTKRDGIAIRGKTRAPSS
tara:strand:+ start:513 stop:983 length:471 start_codon:yes stop_codon:yes gene_type:complete